jgi:protein deglycase
VLKFGYIKKGGKIKLKKVLLFVYDSFAEFEISILITCLNGSGYELVTCSDKQKGETVTSAGKLHIMPDLTIDEIYTENYAALIIPGGSPSSLLNNEKVKSMITSFHEENKWIGAICGGPALLGAAGILDKIKYTASLTHDDKEYVHVMNWDHKLDQFLVKDQNVITATGSNYINFAEEVLRELNAISKDETDPLNYFKEPSMS